MLTVFFLRNNCAWFCIASMAIAMLHAAIFAADTPEENARRARIMAALNKDEPRLQFNSYENLLNALLTNPQPIELAPLQLADANATGTFRTVLALVTLQEPQRHFDIITFQPCSNLWSRFGTNDVLVSSTSLDELLDMYGESTRPGSKLWVRPLIEFGSSLFSDGMVLQTNVTNTIWGAGINGDLIHLKITSSSGQVLSLETNSYKTTVADKRWSFTLFPKADARTAEILQFTLTVNGCGPSFVITNVGEGNVWFFAGDYSVRGPETANDIPQSTRLFRVKPSISATPIISPLSDGWKTGAAIGRLPAVQAAFAQKIDHSPLVTGIILASCGVAFIDAWLPSATPPRLGAATPFEIGTQYSFLSNSVFNAMLAPFMRQTDMPAPIQARGFFWHHGAWQLAQEPQLSNTDYVDNLNSILRNVRDSWPEGKAFVVQLANPVRISDSASGEAWKKVQLDQFNVANRDGFVCVPTWDLEMDGIHPSATSFPLLGGRLAKLALANYETEPLDASAIPTQITITNGFRIGVSTQPSWFTVQSAGKPVTVTNTARDSFNLLLGLAGPINPQNFEVNFAPRDVGGAGHLPLPIFKLKKP